MRTVSRLRFLLPCLAFVAFGAGCSVPFVGGTPNDASTPVLRQPAPAKPPAEQPVIPPEAANVPRPY
ncbi:hypothetical protein L0Y59_02005 [Candidatus Uhrbacteria bacterium]|nr:hypothetical protein [Candidatus Uhrbacteria bacterium]